jgi:hypothetical protein
MELPMCDVVRIEDRALPARRWRPTMSGPLEHAPPEIFAGHAMMVPTPGAGAEDVVRVSR